MEGKPSAGIETFDQHDWTGTARYRTWAKPQYATKHWMGSTQCSRCEAEKHYIRNNMQHFDFETYTYGSDGEYRTCWRLIAKATEDGKA